MTSAPKGGRKKKGKGRGSVSEVGGNLSSRERVKEGEVTGRRKGECWGRKGSRADRGQFETGWL